MPKISNTPPIGAIAFGKSGIGHPITRLESSSVVLQTSNGLLRVPLTSVQHWELPKPKPLKVGDTVQLKGTDRRYQVIQIYSVYRGLVSGESVFEDWAELETPTGQIAYWKVQQLEFLMSKLRSLKAAPKQS